MRKPIGITVPYREVGYKEKLKLLDLTDQEITEILRDYNMAPNPHRMGAAREIIRSFLEKNGITK